ncbi:MAG TPA: hypothetical protein VIP98_25610 [Microlunatus sp.]
MSRPISLFLNESAVADAHAASADAWWLYATEVLDHLRLTYREVDHAESDGTVLIIANADSLTTADNARLSEWVGAGGALIGVGDPGDLAELAGVTVRGAVVDHDHVTVDGAEVITSAPDVALRAIGGVRLQAGDDVTSWATWDDGSAAITVRRLGAGVVLWSGVDVWQSIVRIQQGYAVSEDGQPAADGSAPIDDGILKCEDGMVLDYERDRVLPPGQPELAAYEQKLPPETGLPMFHRPHADLWRSVLLQSVWWAAEQSRSAVGWLHYWPADVPAIAHMSHDSDQNVEEDGRAALDAFAAAGVEVTWCQCFPGGYRPETYVAISEAGHEQALHFNAMADADIARWGWPQLRAQYAWAQAVTGSERIVSNKNHYTRWEGFTDFYRWCERVGIQIDESRGPSKQGTIGFPFGTAHVSFPMADASDDNRYHDVLNLPLHTQDLALAGHESIRDVIIDAAYEQHGVAHFLFHGVHLNRRPATRKACVELADEVRSRGMQWWTAGKINNWERARRGVELDLEVGDGEIKITSTSERELNGAAILIMVPDQDQQLQLSDGVGKLSTVRRHGRDFVQLAVDLPAGEGSWTLVSD